MLARTTTGWPRVFHEREDRHRGAEVRRGPREQREGVLVARPPTAANRAGHQEEQSMRVHVITVPSKRRDAIAASLRDLPAARDISIADQRSVIDATSTDRLDDVGVAREPAELGGVASEWLLVPDRSHEAVVVFLHGGGYVSCSIASHRDRAGRIALAAGCDGVIIDYRLAPEHPYPAALEDALAVCRAVQASGRPVLLAGDSAGGGLVLATMVALRDAGDPLPLAAVCISPWCDLTLSAPSLAARVDRDPFAHLDDLPGSVEAYVAGADPRDPLISPLFADLHGVAPLLVQVGSDEVLFDDARRLAERAAAMGVPTVFEEWIGMFHTWHAYPGALEAADAAIEHAGRFLARHAVPREELVST
jgi:acetyl esterase/lipase